MNDRAVHPGHLVSILTLDPKGNPHPPGTVVRADGKDYRVEDDGSFRRVRVIREVPGGVQFVYLSRLGKAQRKAAKRGHVKARLALEARARAVANAISRSGALNG